jgi:hypothetical protein
MAIGVRLGVWCASAVASLSPALCAAAGGPRPLIVPSAATSAFDSRAGDDSLTVAWIAREGAIRGYTVRVACAPDRVACPDREWFVARQGGAELSHYVVRVRVPPGATMVRVGLEAIDEQGRHLAVAERYVPQAPERLRTGRSAEDASPPTLGACAWSGSFVAPRPFAHATLEERDRPVPPADGSTLAPVPILLCSRGPPFVASLNS